MTVGETRDDGRVEVELRSWSAHALAAEIAPFGARVEVQGAEVRDELARLSVELSRLYGAPSA